MRVRTYIAYFFFCVIAVGVAVASKFPAMLVAVGIGVPISLYGASRLLDLRDSMAWPTVPARVEKAAVGESIELRRYRPPLDYFFPVVTFSYVVGGVTYRRAGYTPFPEDPWSYAREDIEKIVREFDAGKAIEVFYNPEEPSEAYVTRSVSSERLSHYRAICLGGMVVAIPPVVLLGAMAL